MRNYNDDLSGLPPPPAYNSESDNAAVEHSNIVDERGIDVAPVNCK